VLLALGQPIGEATNNEAEYRALLLGLESAAQFGAEFLSIRVDSELLARQLERNYRVRAPNLKPLYDQVQKRLAAFTWEVRSVPREQNRQADALANQALDRGSTVRPQSLF
jgi:ribonuclease HI